MKRLSGKSQPLNSVSFASGFSALRFPTGPRPRNAGRASSKAGAEVPRAGR